MDVDCVAGRFRLVGSLGAGHMGEVHRAEDLQAPPSAFEHERQVAVKTVLRRRSGAPVVTHPDATAVERFAREVSIMRRLDHPNIPRMIDGGVDETNDGMPYLAMELLDGHPLGDLVAEEAQLPVTWVAAIGAQIADGLAAAHAAGVVHRDLKPANVMLTRGGTVKVLDFGMGRITDDPDGTRLTSTGVTVGAVRYLAPEQFEAGLVTEAADLYALGCVLYELLVGVPPFVGNTVYELADRHTHDHPPPLALLRGDVPQGFARLVGRLLAKQPADRPVDAVAVRQALLPFAAARSGPVRLPGWDAFDPVGGLTATRAVQRREAAMAARPTGTELRQERPAGPGMDVFGLHDELIEDYRNFTEGGTVIRDQRFAAFVRDDLEATSQWPDPWLSLNPFFASAGTVAEPASQQVLHEECARIFQAGRTPGGTVCDGRPLTLHRHQREAVDAARSGPGTSSARPWSAPPTRLPTRFPSSASKPPLPGLGPRNPAQPATA